MDASELDRRIDILKRRVVQTGATGEQLEVFDVLTSTWARVVPLKGRDYFDAMQMHAEETITFVIRWRNNVDGFDRVGWQGRFFRIAHIAELGRREGLELQGVLAQN
jgi:SPP1 family predicted phage head-tail adaptor